MNGEGHGPEGRSGSRRPAKASASLPWLAAIGLAAGVFALLALMVMTSLAPLDAEAASQAAMALPGSDMELRIAGLAVVLVASTGLLASAARTATSLTRIEARRQQTRTTGN